jgi:bis(5'-adenosyl)-triphosphatase
MNLKTLSSQTVNFAQHVIPLDQVFLLRKNVYGLINFKPITPGHVLIVPRRVVSRVKELTEIETLDLWVTA